jgi:hypothetical protein
MADGIDWGVGPVNYGAGAPKPIDWSPLTDALKDRQQQQQNQQRQFAQQQSDPATWIPAPREQPSYMDRLRDFLQGTAQGQAPANPNPPVSTDTGVPPGTIDDFTSRFYYTPRQAGGPVELREKPLGQVLREAGTYAGNAGARMLTQLPTVYDAAARGAEWLADRTLPDAISGALRDARQFVETNPNVRRHTYGDVTGNMARTTGLPFGSQPAPSVVMLQPIDHNPFQQ